MFDLRRWGSAGQFSTLAQEYLDILLTPVGSEREVDRHVTEQDAELVGVSLRILLQQGSTP